MNPAAYADQKRGSAADQATDYCYVNSSNLFANVTRCLKGAHIGVAFEGDNPPISLLQACGEPLENDGTYERTAAGEIATQLDQVCADGLAYGVSLVRKHSVGKAQ